MDFRFGLLGRSILALIALLLLSGCGAEAFLAQNRSSELLKTTEGAWEVIRYGSGEEPAATEANSTGENQKTVPALSAAAEAGWPAPETSSTAGPTALPTATLPPSPTLRPTNTPAPEGTPAATLPPTPTLRPTNTATPEQSPTPTQSPTPSPSPTPSKTPLPTAVPINVGGVPLDEIVIMSPEVQNTIRLTAELGRQLGRNPHAFSKIGDSVTLTPHYLARFDSGQYVLGDYGYLQPAIDQYAGSFERFGVATRIGLHAWALFDPLWADKEWCLPNEDMVACEVRLNNPSVLLIRLGSNDSGAESAFNSNMRALIEYALENGIVPILATKADRFEGQDNRNNTIIRQIASEYNVPLWDFDRVADIIPGRGLGGDQVHMTMYDNNDYTDPEAFTRGYPVSDLTALMTIYAVYEEMQQAGDA